MNTAPDSHAGTKRSWKTPVVIAIEIEKCTNVMGIVESSYACQIMSTSFHLSDVCKQKCKITLVKLRENTLVPIFFTTNTNVFARIAFLETSFSCDNIITFVSN